MPERPKVRLVTDGACSGNPGPGGWGCVLRTEAGEWELSGGETVTTNNRMEMLAALRGLEELAEPSQVELTTDSQYLKNGITSWIHGWMRKGWKTASGEPVKNEDLWRELWEQTCVHQIDWRWVRGHAGHADNERCDRLAVAAVERAKRGDTQELRRKVDGSGSAAPATTAPAAKRPVARASSTPTVSAEAPLPGTGRAGELFGGPQPGRNLELKIRCAGLDDVKRRAGTLGGKLQGRLSQDDQFYGATGGERLKLRRELLHLPDGGATRRSELIRYKRADQDAARLSSYEITPVADPDRLHAELAARHGLGVLVRKGREVVLIGRTRLHLDSVAGLGTFVELELVLREGEAPEAAQAELERILRGLGLYGLPVEPKAYADLLGEA